MQLSSNLLRKEDVNTLLGNFIAMIRRRITENLTRQHTLGMLKDRQTFYKNK